MAMKIMRGDSYAIPIDILQDGQVVQPGDVAEIEVSVGTGIQKRMTEGEVVYQNGQWYFRLSQEETFSMEDDAVVYVRVAYPGEPKDVAGVMAGRIMAHETGSTEVL